MEIVLLTKKGIDTLCNLNVGNATVQAKHVVKYLEMNRYSEHLTNPRSGYNIDESDNAQYPLSRPCIHSLLMCTAEFIMYEEGASCGLFLLNRML